MRPVAAHGASLVGVKLPRSLLVLDCVHEFTSLPTFHATANWIAHETDSQVRIRGSFTNSFRCLLKLFMKKTQQNDTKLW